MSDIDNTMHRLTVQQRDQAWREVQIWEQRYQALLKAMTDSVNLRASPPMKLLTDAESFEAGRVMERERIAKMFDGPVWAYDYREIAAEIRKGDVQ